MAVNQPDALQAAEAEARRKVVTELRATVQGSTLVGADMAPLDAYRDAVRATEAARYRGLVGAVRREHQSHAFLGVRRDGGYATEVKFEDCTRLVCVATLAALADNPAPAIDALWCDLCKVFYKDSSHYLNNPNHPPTPIDPAARYRDEAMVERVARAIAAKSLYSPRDMARAALAVIAEPNDVNSTDRG